MEDQVDISTLDKIRLQEQDTEAKLKEKRELEHELWCLNKSIRDVKIQTEKYEQENEKLIKSTDTLRKQKMLEKCRRDSLCAQLSSLKKELKEYRAKSNDAIGKVWEMRSSFCKEIHSVSDACDVWALLMKPSCAEPVPRIQTTVEITTDSENEKRLQVALERRTKALKERDRLTAEPDSGEEFMRIKDALQYSLDKIANNQK